MASIKSPGGQSVAFAGTFGAGRQETLGAKVKEWGASVPEDKAECNVLVATDQAFHKKRTEDVKAAVKGKKWILNENWLQECLEREAWLEPTEHHVYQRGSPAHEVAGEQMSEDQDSDIAMEEIHVAREDHSDGAESSLASEEPATVTGYLTRSKTATNATSKSGPAGSSEKASSSSSSSDELVSELQSQIRHLTQELDRWRTGKLILDSYSPSKDREVQSLVQASDIKHCHEWRNRFHGGNHPDCTQIQLEAQDEVQRPAFKGEIMLITHFRSFLLVIDPDPTTPGFECLRPGYLVRRADYQLTAKKYEQAGGQTVRSSDAGSLEGKNFQDFIWWSIATDAKQYYCYCLGAFKGEYQGTPLLYARSTLKAKWGQAVDDHIQYILREFGQPGLKAYLGSGRRSYDS